MESLKDIICRIVERIGEDGRQDFEGRPARLMAWKILRQALEDLVGLSQHDPLIELDGTDAETLTDAIDWFARPEIGTLSLNVVCQELNMEPDVITYMVRRYLASTIKDAAIPGKRRLKPENVLDIRSRHMAGEPKRLLAIEYKVSRPHISKIVNERRHGRPRRGPGRKRPRRTAA